MDRLRHIREQAGYSQQDLADESGVSQHTISEIELGRRKPQGRTLRKLANALEVRIPDLFEESDSGKAGRRSSPEPSLFSELEDERRRTFVQNCRRYAQTRAEHYERRLTEAKKGGLFSSGLEGARVLFEAAFEEYDELRPLFGRDLAYLLAEDLPDYAALRFSGMAVAALRPLAETLERIADMGAELAETEAQKAEVERRREEMRERLSA